MSRPELSICSMVNVPPARVAAMLAPLRALDAEVVLAVDDRQPAEWIDGYRSLADHVWLVEFPEAFNQLFAWLAAQCSGAWIFQLDADEVPAAGLAAELATTIRADRCSHAFVRRRWLFPDAGHLLAEWPWRPDWSLRLFRNVPGLVRFPGVHHGPVAAVGPRRFLTQPIYHADLVIHDEAVRRRKVERYDTARPGLRMTGRPFNEAYYLPEGRTDLRTEPVPRVDVPVVERFLAADKPPRRWRRRGRGSLRHATRAEMTRSWAQRTVDREGCVAELRLLDEDLRMTVGEPRTFDVEVVNRGDEQWPDEIDADPPIRIGVRWEEPDGTQTEAGPRTPFGVVVDPGEQVVVPARVDAPTTSGMRLLLVGVVLENQLWFAGELRVRVRVAE